MATRRDAPSGGGAKRDFGKIVLQRRQLMTDYLILRRNENVVSL